MEKKKTTFITTETHEVFVIRRPGAQPDPVWCSGCNALVEMVTPGEAVALTGISERAIFRLAESGQLHYAEPPTKLLLICLDSLRTQGCVPALSPTGEEP